MEKRQLKKRCVIKIIHYLYTRKIKTLKINTMNTHYEHISSSNVNGDKSSTFEVFGNRIIVWDVYEQQEIEAVLTQLDIITQLSDNINDIIKHLEINGYQVSIAI